ncbi:Na+/H+ antiporter subunit G [Salinarimonas sp. NSM]|uniref:Na+/H+ antiporter subunit G n=1 Tax=Salinarimonas sp. NSM TaxID=3458003 RepID=UPI0040370312
MMAFAIELLTAALLVVGAFFLLVGSIGLAKLPDMMRRLHGPTKATTLGIGAILIASMINAWAVRGYLSLHELLITIFLFLAAPITAYMIAKAHILHDRETQDALPPTGVGTPWMTLAPPEGDASGASRAPEASEGM